MSVESLPTCRHCNHPVDPDGMVAADPLDGRPMHVGCHADVTEPKRRRQTYNERQARKVNQRQTLIRLREDMHAVLQDVAYWLGLPKVKKVNGADELLARVVELLKKVPDK